MQKYIFPNFDFNQLDSAIFLGLSKLLPNAKANEENFYTLELQTIKHRYTIEFDGYVNLTENALNNGGIQIIELKPLLGVKLMNIVAKQYKDIRDYQQLLIIYKSFDINIKKEMVCAVRNLTITVE